MSESPIVSAAGEPLHLLVRKPPEGIAPPRSTTLLLHLGFALTGAGTVLLGCLLPRLSVAEHLRDKDAGLLLMVQFATSALGALLVRGNFWRTLACGYVLISASSFSIVFLPDRASLLAFGCYGLGLGLAMTSTSMLIGRLYPRRKGAALAILNLCWSAGAMACPLLVARFLERTGSSIAFAPMALLAAPFALLPLLAPRRNWNSADRVTHNLVGIDEKRKIFYFALLGFLYVGIESVVGNWTSTYATRAISWNFSHSSLAVFCFWAALLLGRAITPGILGILSERSLYRLSVLAMTAGVALLLMADSAWMLLAGAALTGLALGPLFPLTLSLFMTEVGESRNAGWVFCMAGLGGAVLSWLTGAVSTAAGSLRMGLIVPAAAALLMTIMIFSARCDRQTDLPSSSEHRPVLPPA